MTVGLSGQEPSDQRIIKIDTARILGREKSHYGVIDIGSNSIRLVVYDGLNRAPFPRFNEKSMVALGAGIDKDNCFSQDTISRALKAIKRLDAISRAMQVERVDVLATEAMRRADNGAQLIDAITETTGLKTRVLSGEEEAYYAAHGVISGFYQPSGMIGDIGGGSLEVAEVIADSVGERMCSMPLGALPVTAKLAEGYNSAKKWVDQILAENLPPMLTNPVFYAVGGGWRALARIHIAMNQQPISVVHGYEVSAKEMQSLARDISQMSPDEVSRLPDVPNRRIATLSASALVMARVLRQLKPERIAFSAYGLREGWLYEQLDQVEQYRDPLLEGAQAVGLPVARVPAFSEALSDWTAELFPGETQSEKRLRLAACALTDMAWREHEKIRAADCFLRLLQFPFIGLSHPERVFIAVAILGRYDGKLDEKMKSTTSKFLTNSELRRAEILGRALLLGHRFSASVPEILLQSRLRIDADAVRLEILNTESVPDSDAVQNRLRKLAKSAGIGDTEIKYKHGNS